MRKVLLFLFMAVLTIGIHAKVGKQLGLFYVYSTEDNVYEDDNIKLEILGSRVYLTYKLNEVIYIDPKKTFFYESGDGINKTDADQIVSVQPASKTLIHEFYLGLESMIFTTRTDVTRFAIGNVIGKLGLKITESGAAVLQRWDVENDVPRICPQTDAYYDFIATIGELYTQLEDDKKSSSKHLHLTKDESFLNQKVALAYSLNSDYSNSITVSKSSWVSDVFLANYSVPEEGGSKKKDGFAVRNKKYAQINIEADSPFEDDDADQEKSPVCCYKIAFGKGMFVIDYAWKHRAKVKFLGQSKGSKK